MSRSERNIRHYTQWAAQFYVAGELSRRGYLVGFPLGNAEATDLVAVSPRGRRFSVEVKGLRNPNPWPIGREQKRRAGYLILTHVVKVPERPHFFVLSRQQLRRVFQDDPKFPSIPWSAAKRYEDRWRTLPR